MSDANGSSPANGSSAPKPGDRDGFWLQQLVNTERPARMVGLFSMRQLRPHDLGRLVAVCEQAMRDEGEPGAQLTLAPLGAPSPEELGQQKSFRLTVQDGEASAAHDCLVQLYALEDPASPHRALLDHLTGMDPELGEEVRRAAANSLAYLSIASGKLDAPERIHPYQNLVSLFASALGAWIVDPAGAICTQDPGEWADAIEMSLQLEKEMGLLRR